MQWNHFSWWESCKTILKNEQKIVHQLKNYGEELLIAHQKTTKNTCLTKIDLKTFEDSTYQTFELNYTISDIAGI